MATYRQQSGSTLGTSQTCPVCSVSLTLSFDATNADGLCCGSPQTVTRYVPTGTTFANATTLYQDNALTTIADAGFYSDDV
jgi:hypothetical protein